MDRPSLTELRARIEALASGTGEYSLRCCRSGDRPVPAAGLRFETRSVARAAASATGQYRAALRQYDPSLPRYDIVVCQEPIPPASARRRSVDCSEFRSVRRSR